MTAVLQTTIERRALPPGDSAVLRELFAESLPASLLLPADSRDLVVDMRLHDRRRRLRVEFPSARTELLVSDGTPAGLLVVDESDAAVRLIEFGLRPQHRGRGLGGRVLAQLLADADRTRRTVTARVAASQPALRRWYEQHGFGVGLAVAGALELTRPPVEAC